MCCERERLRWNISIFDGAEGAGAKKSCSLSPAWVLRKFCADLMHQYPHEAGGTAVFRQTLSLHERVVRWRSQ